MNMVAEGRINIFSLLSPLTYESQIRTLTENQQNDVQVGYIRALAEKTKMILNSLDEDKNKSIKYANETRGDITKYKYFSEIDDMLKHLVRQYPSNKEIIDLNLLMKTLIENTPEHKRAYTENRTFGKLVFLSSFLQLNYGIVKAYLVNINMTKSKNNGRLILGEKDVDIYNANEEKNIKNLIQTNGNIERINKGEEKNFSIVLGTISVLSAIGFVVFGFQASMLILRDIQAHLYEYLSSYSYVKKTINEKTPTEAEKIILQIIDKIEKYRDKFFTPFLSTNENVQQFMSKPDFGLEYKHHNPISHPSGNKYEKDTKANDSNDYF
jgi:hypothetical protein